MSANANNTVDQHLEAMVRDNYRLLFGDTRPDEYVIQTRFIRPLSEAVALMALEVRQQPNGNANANVSGGGRPKKKYVR